jgi:hypothetical protein
MNTLQNVYNKLADKTELAKHEVNLGLADDVKKAYADAINARKKSFDDYEKLRPIVALALKNQLDLQKINENAIPIFTKFELAAKELGIAVPKEILDQKKNLQDGLKGGIAVKIKTLQSIKL